MPRSLTHVFLSHEIAEIANQPGSFAAQEFPIRINRVGRLSVLVQATHITENLPPPPPIPGQPPPPKPPGGTKPATVTPFNFERTLFDPNGVPFTQPIITQEDLNKYRDLRGFVRPWTLRIPASHNPPTPITRVVGPQKILVKVDEVLATSSAPPLADFRRRIAGLHEIQFDLYRVGRLSVTVRRSIGPITVSAPVTVALLRPDGSTRGRTTNGRLNLTISLADLRHSRGPNGAVRKWRLRIEAPAATYRVHAQVFATASIAASALESRFKALLGENGEKLTLGANWIASRKTNRFTLRINDALLAETFGIHHVLGGLDRSLNLGIDLDTPVTGRDYVLSQDEMVFETGFFRAQGQCKNITTTSLKITLGQSVERRALKLVPVGTIGGRTHYELQPAGDVMIPANLPMFAIDITVSGHIHVNVDHWDDADLVIPKVRIEVALEVKPDGRLGARCWIDPNSVRHGGNEGSPHHPLRNDANHVKFKLQEKSASLTRSFTRIFEDIFDRLVGGVFTYTAARWTGSAMAFDYVAGVEPERKPNIGYVARGNFGISVVPGRPGPGTLVNTWSSPNLSKIDHIVVLIMENRSFDHVLGYLSLDEPPVVGPVTPRQPKSAARPAAAAINPNVNGLTKQVIQSFSTPGTEIRPLATAGFAANAAGLKTKIPLGVGHAVRDVTQQLANKTMTGFAANFAAIHTTADFQRTGCKPRDALGYYTASDLPMYAYLASEFAVCDRYFCAHPGPTLPNRMYSLTGDLQRDRNGEPRIDNGLDSSFFLAREQTIFDLLTQRGVSWRVYESPPSVTMLRMFSRYAGDDVNIRDIRHLENDIALSGLPSVTFIDPSLHDAPANDDHPPADMLHGQHFIQRIYNALRSKPSLWDKTLFVITYDEHGGLFDHVVPEVAEVLQDPQKIIDAGTVSMRAARSASRRRVRGSGVRGGIGGGVIDVGGIGGVVLDPNPDKPPPRPRYLPNQEIIYGVRVPTFLVSPFVDKGSVIKRPFDHASILKTILIRFCPGERPFMSDRVHHAFDLGSALTQPAPRAINTRQPVLPRLPDQRKPRTQRALAKNFRAIRISDLIRDDADWHDIMAVLSRTVRPPARATRSTRKPRTTRKAATTRAATRRRPAQAAKRKTTTRRSPPRASASRRRSTRAGNGRPRGRPSRRKQR